MPVYLSAPPYAASAPAPLVQGSGIAAVVPHPPVGTIAVADAVVDLSSLFDLVSLLRHCPWLPSCAVIANAAGERAATVIGLTLADVAVVRVNPGESPDLLMRSIRAIQKRPPVSASHLADYIVRRTQRPDFRDSLMACFNSPPRLFAAAIHRSTVYRKLRRLSGLTPRDWAGVAQLATVLGSHSMSPPPSLESLALTAGTTTSTFLARIVRLLGVSAQAARSRLGWEWVVEAALRAHCYDQIFSVSTADSFRPHTR